MVDTTQGVEAQTVSNLLLAMEHDLAIIPILNKIDMPAAQVEAVQRQVIDLMGGTPDDMLLVSAKQGIGVEEVLETIVTRIPPPAGARDSSLRALIFDSLYDHYRGVICFVRVVDGGSPAAEAGIRAGDQVSKLDIDTPSSRIGLRSGNIVAPRSDTTAASSPRRATWCGSVRLRVICSKSV